jgi:hypothetical protein
LLKNGAHVEIHGLQNATHLNGKTGRLKTFHREGSHAGRWEVRAVGGESHAVKPENLKHVAGSNIAATTPSIRAGPMGPASGAVYHPSNDAWANDLSVEDQYEWLSNRYNNNNNNNNNKQYYTKKGYRRLTSSNFMARHTHTARRRKEHSDEEMHVKVMNAFFHKEPRARVIYIF